MDNQTLNITDPRICRFVQRAVDSYATSGHITGDDKQIIQEAQQLIRQQLGSQSSAASASSGQSGTSGTQSGTGQTGQAQNK